MSTDNEVNTIQPTSVQAARSCYLYADRYILPVHPLLPLPIPPLLRLFNSMVSSYYFKIVLRACLLMRAAGPLAFAVEQRRAGHAGKRAVMNNNKQDESALLGHCRGVFAKASYIDIGTKE